MLFGLLYKFYTYILVKAFKHTNSFAISVFYSSFNGTIKSILVSNIFLLLYFEKHDLTLYFGINY